MADIGFQLDPYSIEGGVADYTDNFIVLIDGQIFAITNCTAPSNCDAQKADGFPNVVTFNLSNVPAGQLTLKLDSDEYGLLDADFSLEVPDQDGFASLTSQCDGSCTPVFFSLPPGPQCNILFNEFVSKDLLQSSYDVGPDWIELYNRSPLDIDLSNYYINIYQGSRSRDDKYRWWNNYYNMEFENCPVYYADDGCDDNYDDGDVGSIPYANRIDVPIPSYPMSFNSPENNSIFEVDGNGNLAEIPGAVNLPLRKLYGGHWEDNVSWNGLVNSNESSCADSHVCIKGRDLETGEGGRFWIIGNKNQKGIFSAGPVEGFTGDDWYASDDIDLASKLCSTNDCTGKNASGNIVSNAGWGDFNFNVSNINSYNLDGAFTSYVYYEIPKSTSTRKYTIELWKGNPNKYICDTPDPGTNNYYRPCGLQDQTLNGLNDECPLNSQCVLASTILPEPELECSMTYGASDWPTTTSDRTNKSFQFIRTEDDSLDTNDINYFYNWSYAQNDTEYNSDGYSDDYYDATEKTEYIDFEDDEDTYDEYPEYYNNNKGFVFPDWFTAVGFYQDWEDVGECMQTSDFSSNICYNGDLVASPLRKNSRTVVGDIIPACTNPGAENYYCYWNDGDYDSTQCEDYWTCNLDNFDYATINQNLCPSGQLPYNIASSLNLCVFPPTPACLDTGNGEFIPSHKYVSDDTPALNVPDDVWICNHNQSTCVGPESNECGAGNECVFNQWSYRECIDSWDNPSGTPGGCCEYPAEINFGVVGVDEIGFGEASGTTSINGSFSFPIFSISNMHISGIAGGNYSISSTSGEGDNMISTSDDDYFDNYNFALSHNIPNPTGGGATKITLTDPIVAPTERANNSQLFSILWDNDWGTGDFSSYRELLAGSQSYFTNMQNWLITYQLPLYPDLLTPSYISEFYGDTFSPVESTSVSFYLTIDCNGVPTNTFYDFASVDFCNICNGGTTDNDDPNICDGDDLGGGQCSEDFSGPNFDDCGVCDGGNQDQDCAGVCFGDGAEDCLGVCNGPNESDGFGGCCNLDTETDCAGYCFGTNIYNCFGECVSGGSEDGCGTGGSCDYDSNNTSGGGSCICSEGYWGGVESTCVECPDCGIFGSCDDYLNQNTGECICDTGYYDGTCGECCDFNCNNVGNCNDNGTCIAPDTCECNENFNCDSDGDGILDCGLPICNGVCGDGSCQNGGYCDFDSPGVCTCPDYWIGDYCETADCGGDCSPGTCNGNTGLCECSGTGYCGDFCDIPECNSGCGDANCNGNGECLSPGDCSCDANYCGPGCNSIMCNNTCDYPLIATNCGAYGTCTTAGSACECISGYCGNWCDQAECNGVCQSVDGGDDDGCVNGTCQLGGTCSCDAGWSGDDCNTIQCNGVDNGSCLNGGICDDPGGVCNCDGTGFCGNYCEIPVCNGVCGTGSSDGCGTNGVCQSNGSCSCDAGYCGDACELNICNGICDNDCGFGTCPSPGDCDCGATGYCGAQCDVPICNGYCEETDVSGFNGCLNGGTCTIDGCECAENYCGNDCSDINSGGNCPDQCQNGGTPVAGDDCSCPSGYCGSNCEFFICNGTCATDGIGTCENGSSCTSANGTCTCVGNWDGDFCDLSVCGGVTSSDTDGTNTYCINGYCNTSGTGACVCDDGWGGAQCDVPSGDCNTECNNGSCTSDPDICDCASNYYKDYSGTTTGDNVDCDYVLCNGEIVNISTGLNVDGQSPCENSGTCTSTAGCSCINNWTGDSCDIPICNGVPGGNCVNGSCDTPGDCVCDDGWCGTACDTPECAGGCGAENCLNGGTCPDENAGGDCLCPENQWDGSTCSDIMCNGVVGGDCVEGSCTVAGGVCTCTDPTDYCGDYCDIPICNGVCGEGDLDGCGVNGTCEGPDNCNCGDSGYCGTDCNTPMCFGNCGATGYDGCLNGTCSGVDTCSCDAGWGGDDCSIAICNGVEGGDCVNGTCDTPSATCDCSGTNYCGNYCETPICFGSCGDLGCQNGGTCDDVNTCNCTGTGYCGNQCQTPECNGGCGDAECTPNGSCIYPGDCTCVYGWCGSGCDIPICGICATDGIGSCQNGGTCSAPDTCDCLEGWTGNYCQTAICNSVPGGNCQNGGTCDTPGTCVCPAGYFGDDCSGVCNCNGGTCDDYFGGNTGNCLDCPDGLYGLNCENLVECENGTCNDSDTSSATCSGVNGNGHCDFCMDGWAGENCNIECPGGASSPCNGNGSCNHGVSGDGTCDCDELWDCNDSCSVAKDCHGVCGGSNQLDDCEICSCYGSNCGDNNHLPNSDQDCAGTCPNEPGFGALRDDCGCCVEGNTGFEASYLSGGGECDTGTFMDDCCLCDYSNSTSCDSSLSSNGALGSITVSEGGVGSYNGVSIYPGTWTYDNSADCAGNCFGPNQSITGGWGNHCCCHDDISPLCEGVVGNCGCFEDNCYDCNEIPYGEASYDSCSVCSGGTTDNEIHVGNCIPENYGWDDSIASVPCLEGTCSAGFYCFVSADNLQSNDRLNDTCGICNGDNSTCNIRLSFGEIDMNRNQINVFINNSNSRANYISEIRLPIYTNGNVLLTSIDYGDGGLASTILGDNIALFSMTEPEMYVFNGTEEGYISNVTMNFGQTDVYLPPTGGNELLFTLNWEILSADAEDQNMYFHLFDPYSNSNDVEIDTYQPHPYNGTPIPMSVISHSSISDAGDSIIELSPSINSVYGCMDPYAINCDSEACGCDPQLKYCVNIHDQGTCEYPSVDFTNVTFDGSIIQTGILINPLSGIQSGYDDSDLLYTFGYDNFDSMFGYGNIHENDKFVDIILSNSSGEVARYNSISIDAGAYAAQIFDDALVDLQDPLWDMMRGYPTDDVYTFSIVWPSDYENIVDPVEDGSATLPRIKSDFSFQISKSGCRVLYQSPPVGEGNLSSPTGFVFTNNNDFIEDGLNEYGAIVSGYNSWASADCEGVSGGTNIDCCLYEDNYQNYCTFSEKDDCYICPDSTSNYEVSYNWYQDHDNDGIPCDSGFITGICPYMTPTTNYGQSGIWIQGGESDHGTLPTPESGDACLCAAPAVVKDSCGICVNSLTNENADACGMCPTIIDDVISSIEVTYDDGYMETLYYVAPGDESNKDCAGQCPTGSPICEEGHFYYNETACDSYGAYRDGCGVCSGGLSVDPITQQIPHIAHSNVDKCGVCHTDLSLDGYYNGSGEYGNISNQNSTWNTNCPSCDQNELQISDYSCDFSIAWPASSEWDNSGINPVCCVASGGRVKLNVTPDGEGIAATCDGGNGLTNDNLQKLYYDSCGICSGINNTYGYSHEANIGTCYTISVDSDITLTKEEMRDFCKNDPESCEDTTVSCNQSFTSGVLDDDCPSESFCFVTGIDAGCSGQCGRIDSIDIENLSTPHCCCDYECVSWWENLTGDDPYIYKPGFIYGSQPNDMRLYYPDLDTAYCSNDRTKLCTIMDVINCDGNYCDACDMQGTCVLGSEVYSLCSQSTSVECSLLQGVMNDSSPCPNDPENDFCTIFATGETVFFSDDIDIAGEPTTPIEVCSSQNRTITFTGQNQGEYPPGTEFLYTWISDDCAGWISPNYCIVEGTDNYYCFENESDIDSILDCNNACPSDSVGSLVNSCSQYGNYDDICILYGPECKPSCDEESDYDNGCFNGPVCSADTSVSCWSNIPNINELGLLVGGPGHVDVTLCPDYVSPENQGEGCDIPEELPFTIANGITDTNVCEQTPDGVQMYPTNIGNPGDGADNSWDSGCRVCADDEAINTYIDSIVYIDNSLCTYATPVQTVSALDLNDDGIISDTDYYPLSTFDGGVDDTLVPVHSSFIITATSEVQLKNPISMSFGYEGPYKEIIITRELNGEESTLYLSEGIEQENISITNENAPANGLDNWNYPYGTEWLFTDLFLTSESQSLISEQLTSFQVGYKITIVDQNDNLLEGDFYYYNALLFTPQLTFLSPQNNDSYSCNENVDIIIDYKNIPLDDSLYMAKLEVWGLPYNYLVTDPQLLDYSNFQIDFWNDESYIGFNSNGTQLQPDDCDMPCNPGDNFWYCTKPIDVNGDGFPDWGNWTAQLPNEGQVSFGNTLESIIPNYQFKFEEDCNSICDIECSTEHHLVFPTNGNFGEGVINMWNEDVWRSGEVTLYIKYPQDGSNQSTYDTVTFNVNVSQGCTHAPASNDDGTYSGACTCETCYSLCPIGCEAMNSNQEGWESLMQDCYEMGFYNPNSCTGICDNPDDSSHGNLCHHDQDCNIGEDYYENPIHGEYSKYRGCTRFSKVSEQLSSASGACIYPTYGCTDDGNKIGGVCDTNSSNSGEDCGDFFDCLPNSGDVLGNCILQNGTYINNQYGYGSVIPGIPADNCESLSCDNCAEVSYIVGNSGEYLDCATTEFPANSSCIYSACNDVQALTYWANYPEFAVGPNLEYNYELCEGQKNIENCGVGDETYWTSGVNDEGEDFCLYEFQFRLLYQVRSTKYCLDESAGLTFMCSDGVNTCNDGTDDECPGDETCLLPTQCDIDLDCPNNEICYSGDLTPVEFGQIPLDKYSNYDSNNIKDIVRITKPKIFEHGGPQTFDIVFWIEGNSEMNSNYPWLPSVGNSDDVLLVDYQNGTENPWKFYNWNFTEELTDGCTTEDEVCEGPSIELTNESILTPNEMSYVYEADANNYRYGIQNGTFTYPIDQTDTNIAIKVNLDVPYDPDPNDQISSSAERTIYISLVRNDYLPRVILDNDPNNDGQSTLAEKNPILDVIDTEPISYNFSVEEFNYGGSSYNESDPVDTTITSLEVSPSYGLSAVFNGYTDNVGTILLGPPAVRGMWTVFVRLTQLEIKHPVYQDVIRPMVVSTPATFTVSALNTQGPSGSVLGVTVSSFGISPDTWQFKVIGDDKRRYLEFPDPSVPPAIPEVLESYEIPLKLGYITSRRADGVCSNDVMSLEWTYSNYICVGAPAFDEECVNDNSTCNGGNNQCQGEPGTETPSATSYPLPCQYGTNYYFDGTQSIPFSADDYCSYIGSMQDIEGSVCNGNYGGDTSLESLVYECNINVESIDLVQRAFNNLPDSGHEIVEKLSQVESNTGQTYNGYNSYDFYENNAPFINLPYQTPIVVWGNDQWPSNFECWIPNNNPLSSGETYYQEYQEEVPGGTMSYPNPNLGGWTTQNMKTEENPFGDSKDTVWMYELQFFKCLDDECDRDIGTCSTDVDMDNNFDSCLYYEGIDSWDGTSAQFIHSRVFKDWWSPEDNGRSLLPVYDTECTGGNLPDDNGLCDPGYESSLTYESLGNTSSDVLVNDMNGYVNQGGVDPSMGYNRIYDLINRGYKFRFLESGLYKVRVKAYDLYYNSATTFGSEDSDVMVDYIIPIEQTLPDLYLPYQGLNIPPESGYLYQNDFDRDMQTITINDYDVDDRPVLGCFYQDEDSWGGEYWIGLVRNEYTTDDDRFSKWYIPIFVCEDDETIQCYGTDDDTTCADLESSTRCIYNDSISEDEKDNRPDFTVDVDVRVRAADGIKETTLFKYWDADIHPNEYEESVGPATVQFYFYQRHGEGSRCNEQSTNANQICGSDSDCENGQCIDNNVLSPRETLLLEEPDPRDEEYGILDYQTLLFDNLNEYYITRVNWGDGVQEFWDEPFRLSNSMILTHDYEKAGIYEVTGYMFSLVSHIEGEAAEGDVIQQGDPGVRQFQKFKVVFSLNKSDNNIYDFPQLGGIDYTYIPQGDVVNEENVVIGGISANSLYAKTLKRRIGYSSAITTPEEPQIFDVKWPFYQDKLDAEYALSQVDQRLVGKDISRFTGSNAASSSQYITEDNLIYDWDTQLVEASRAHGYYSGSVDSITGEILPEPTPKIIHRGSYKYYGNLGDHIGDADLGQVRFMNKPMEMYEMLGFDSYTLQLSGHPQDEWSNNQEVRDKNTYVWESHTVSLNDITVHENIQYIIGGNNNIAMWDPEIGWLGQLTELVIGESYIFQSFNDVGSYTWDTGLPSPAAIPSSEKYWKNIIPSDYELSDRSGIFYEGENLPYFVCEGNMSVSCNGLDDEESCNYLAEDGMSTLCISADICENEICVDENDPQYWDGANIYNQRYYYPVLPKVTRYRTFDKYQLQNDNNYFYGTKTRWNANDKIAPITNNDFYDYDDIHMNKLIIDLNFDDISSETILDRMGGGYLGIFTGDYKIEFSEDYKNQDKRGWIGLPEKDITEGGKQY